MGPISNGKRKSHAVVDLTGSDDERPYKSSRPLPTNGQLSQVINGEDSEDDAHDIIDLSQDFDDDTYRGFELYGMSDASN